MTNLVLIRSVSLDELDNKGVKVLESNSDTTYVRVLYKRYNINTIYANRFINRDVDNRGKVNEVLISNI